MTFCQIRDPAKRLDELVKLQKMQENWFKYYRVLESSVLVKDVTAKGSGYHHFDGVKAFAY